MSIEQPKNISLQEQYPNLTCFGRTHIWIYEHPTTIKVLKVAALILGLGLLGALPFTAPLLGTAIVVSLAITGTVLTVAAIIAFLTLDFLIPPHHDMKNHVYKPGTCEGGQLFYDGDVPILSLDSSDPFKVGKAHGYLCGDAINRLTKRFALAQHTLSGMPRASQLPQTLQAIRQWIPKKYLKEMEGLAEGYKQWAQEQSWWQFPNHLSVDDILLFHLMPDSIHFTAGLEFENTLKTYDQAEQTSPPKAVAPAVPALACAAIVNKNAEDQFVFARNMDWPSLGLAGAYSLVIHRKNINEITTSTVEVGLPGFIGTLTGMNSHGLSIAMNVCSGETRGIRGMPATFYNRECLENCETVEGVKAFVNNEGSLGYNDYPLGPYHLTVADQTTAASVHFYQSTEETHVFRDWDETTHAPLTTLNYRYNPNPRSDMHNSQERQERIDQFFKNRENQPLEDTLSLPFVNNGMTTHRVVMEPNTKRFRVAFDNAFAGKAPLHEVSTQKLFDNSFVHKKVKKPSFSSCKN